MSRMFMQLAGLGSALAVVCCVRAVSAANYFVDQVVHYGSCPGKDLWDDTYKLVSKMKAHNWTGSKLIDADAWPHDFREHCSSTYGSSGVDAHYADKVDFAIFSGHGDGGRAFFGYPQLGVCTHDLGSNGRLGSMDGAEASVAMWISCSTMDVSYLASDVNKQWLHQQLGFHDPVGNNTSRYASFFQDTCGAKPTSEAWLDRLEDEPAIVVSYGEDASDCWFVHDLNYLCLRAGLYPRHGGPSCGQGQPHFHYCGDYN